MGSSMRSTLALLLFVAGCAVGPGGGGGGGGGGDGGSGSAAPPFTNGVSTLAGAADAGYVDGSRDVARFKNPVGVAVGSDGLVYVADFDNSKLRAVAPDGTTTTIIDDPMFVRPFALAFAPSGTLYVITDNDDTGKGHGAMSGTVWKVDVHAKTATVLANAIGRPRGIAVLTDGRVALADYHHHLIELLDPATGKLTTLAGTWDAVGYADGAAAAARFNQPTGIVQGTDGRLVVCDYGNNRLRSVGLDGSVSTMAGSGKAGFSDGAMTGAQFNLPEGIARDQAGDLFISDTGNFRVREISGTTVTTIAGNGTGGYIDADDRLSSELYGLEGIAVRADGKMVYVADGNRGDDGPYNRVRQVDLSH